jgi:hypothetical protein
MLLYGFPSASLLLKALQHQKRRGGPFLYEGSRSGLIRSLSVFISYLETTVHPGNANYALFQRGSQVFSQMVDEILEPETSITDPEFDESALVDFDQIFNADQSDLFNSNAIDLGVAFNEWLV